MAFAILAFDGVDDEAPERRAAARDAHVAFITKEAAAGRLALGLPLHDEMGRSRGSLMVLDVADRAALDAYLAAEPFARQGVWHRVTSHAFRIAPLPYPAWPITASDGRTHTVVVAADGTDPGAEARRLAARPRHLARARDEAERGVIAFGGAIISQGRMTGSIAVTRHATAAEARAWWEQDPYMTEGVWQDLAFHGTVFRPLPYKPLPR
jgi:uncharacterized protein YciI